jgi:diguanylate cyclase (GGDEF)-like protein
MKSPGQHPDEQKRLETLRSLKLLDSAPEERFDRLTRLAKRMFGVPISLVSLVDNDRQWFKSAQGLSVPETPRDISFCGHAILGDEIMMVPDALEDLRFVDNPLVVNEPNIRFYAGCPLKVPNGSKIGTLCIIDREPRAFSSEDLALLRDLAAMAEREIAAVQLATLDELTLISNRRGFMALAQQALNMLHRDGRSARLLAFDLDRFKEINDRFGHAEGDRALVAFAGIMREVFREADVFARIGGDEFVALIDDSGDGATSTLLKRFREAVDSHNAQAQRGYDIRYSVGEAETDPEHRHSIEDLLARADTKMYGDNKRTR